MGRYLGYDAIWSQVNIINIQPMKSFADIQNLLKDEFEAVNNLILNSLNIEGQLIQQIGEHIINSGGKRIRPLLVLLTAKALGTLNEDHIRLSAIVEFIHTVTLLHDDVVDASELRHGKKTANFIWGNEASILVGDFLYSRAFQMMADLNNLAVIKVFADTTNKIAGGEVLQLAYRQSTKTNEAIYMEIIQGKTGALFEASTHLSAILSQSTHEQQKALGTYGLHLGAAFQIVDDILDYQGKESALGKHIGDDLSEGKSTLPLIHAIQHSNPDQVKLIEETIAHKNLNNLNSILDIIQSTGSLEYAKQKAMEQALIAKGALNCLPPSVYKEALVAIAEMILKRNH